MKFETLIKSIKKIFTIILIVISMFCIFSCKAIDNVKEKLPIKINEESNKNGSKQGNSKKNDLSEKEEEKDIPSYQTIQSGTYFDILSERATMDVSFKDKTYYFEVNWANSASENMRWIFSGKYDKFSGIIPYDNAKCTYNIYDENGNITDERIIFDNGKGVMKFDDNKLYWDDNNSDKVLDAHYNGIFEMPNGV